MGEMLGTISISSLTTMTCLSLVALALGAASTASGGRVVSVDYCLGNQIPPAQKHSVSQALRHTSLPAHIRAFSGATNDTVGVDDGCEHLVTAVDGAVEILLSCPGVGGRNYTALSPGLAGVNTNALDKAGVVTRDVPHSDCVIFGLRTSSSFTAVTALAENAGFMVDALVLPETIATTSAHIVANSVADAAGVAQTRAIKDEVVRGVSDVAGYLTLLEQLTGATSVTLPDGSDWTIKSRNTYQTVQSLVAAEWLADWFTTNANLESSLREFSCCSNTVARNVVARLPGSGSGAKEVVVVGAHMDSLPTGDIAPGAVDNGSGTVALLVLAQEFAKHSWNRTIEFVAFGAEEQGIHGSAEYVQRAGTDGVDIVSALCMDMIAYSNRFFGVTIEGTTNAAIQELMRVVEGNTKEYAPELEVKLTDNSFGSDHVSFQRAGIPAVLAIELDDTNYPHYHRATDTVSETTPKQAVDIIKGFAATLVDLVGVD